MCSRKRRHLSLRTVLGAVAIIATLGIVAVDPWNFINHNGVYRTHALTINPDTKMIYLSDLEYDTGKTSVGYAQVTYDQNLETRYNNGLIALNVDGAKKMFIKGVVAHANSTVVYNLTDLQDFDFFTAYIGNDASRGANGDGVKFMFSTSADGENWEDKTPDNVRDVVFKGESDAIKVRIDLSGSKYLRLQANGIRNITADHSTYADAKLIKADYVESDNTVDFIKPVSEYDVILQNTALESQLVDNELVLLQRQFVNAFGYDILQTYAAYSEDYRETLNWILHDLTALRYYITGGAPTGSYVNSLKVLVRLYTQYKDDLNDNSVTALGTTRSDLYLRMMISLSLTHSATVGSWVGGGQYSDAVKRYEVYKNLQAQDLLENRIFETLGIEEMRWVMNNQLTDDELSWLNMYARRFPGGSGRPNEPYERQPYRFIRYTFGYNYARDIYYDPLRQTEWNDKYDFMSYGVPYGETGKPKLWMVFEEGAVCGGTSKTGSNLNAALGYPTAVIGQPGHAAYLEYWQTDNGQGYWGIQNNISGWTHSEKSERMLAGWGSSNWDSYYQVSYVPYAQNALNDLENYNRALETILLANTYPNDYLKQEQIYRQALSYQDYHLDAWYGLIRTYQASGTKTEEDFLALARELVAKMYYYPLPMYDLLNLMKANITSANGGARLMSILHNALEDGTKVGDDSGLLQPAITRTMANYLLGNTDNSVASFSFDGEHAGQIVLAERFQDNNEEIYYEYSLDGQATWTQTRNPIQQLNSDEITAINADNDIIIHFVGAAQDNIFVIDITPQDAPSGIYNNDLENKVIGASEIMEWRLNENDAWTSFRTAAPDLSGDKTVWVRYGANSTRLTSEAVSLSYTADEINPKRQYVTIDRLAIAGVSSEATAQKRYATNAIDGNINTNWHSAWNGSDRERYITVEFNSPILLSAFDYIPGDGGNGRVLDGELYGSMDGESWQPLASFDGWANNSSTKTLEIENPELVKYVKLVGKRTSSAGGGSFMTARMLNFYEDVTMAPTATVRYSTTDPTNQNVTATLDNLTGGASIINNDGNGAYVFEDNGSFTFEIEGTNGLHNFIVATVDWIDRVAPQASVVYQELSDGSVMATLSHENEEIVMLGDGNRSHHFLQNGEHTFEYRDLAGNLGRSVAKVDWIKERQPDQPEQPGQPERPSQPEQPNWPSQPSGRPGGSNGSSSVSGSNGSSGTSNAGSTSNPNASSQLGTTNNGQTVAGGIQAVVKNPDTVSANLTLSTKPLQLTGSLKQRFGGNSEYFSVYFVNANGERMPNDAEVIITLPRQTDKTLKGVYRIYADGSANQLDYTLLEDGQIRILAPNTGEYLVAYEDEAQNIAKATDVQGAQAESSESETGSSNSWMWWLVGAAGVIFFLAIIGGAVSNRRR